jgi:VIT1/CCC1 family predicted Fe2+/Mn2+ transporter
VRALGRLARREPLALVLGVSDGILTALTLGAGRLVGAGPPLDVDLALRISIAATLTDGFVFFVARYAELRRTLMHAEKELSMHSHLAATALGGRVLRESAQAALIAAAAGFPGALLPLGIGVAAAPDSWLAIVAAVAMLAALGVLIARSVAGSSIRWVAAMVTSGLLLSLAGAALRIA